MSVTLTSSVRAGPRLPLSQRTGSGRQWSMRVWPLWPFRTLAMFLRAELFQPGTVTRGQLITLARWTRSFVMCGVSSGSTGGRRTPLSGQTVPVANLLGHGDVPDSDLEDLEWRLPPLSALALRGLIGGSFGQLKSARVGLVVAASLHSLVNVGSRVVRWTRAQATLNTPDNKALLDIVDRNGLRTDLAHELGEASMMAHNEWRGEAPGSHVRGRDDIDAKENSRAETPNRN